MWAAALASRTGTPLRVVHAPEALYLMTDVAVMGQEPAIAQHRAAGEKVLDEASTVVRLRFPELDVHTVLVPRPDADRNRPVNIAELRRTGRPLVPHSQHHANHRRFVRRRRRCRYAPARSREGRHRGYSPSGQLPVAAATMASVTATDWDMSTACEAATSVVRAPMRPAMKRCEAGGMMLSPVGIRDQLGVFDQEVAPDGSRLAHTAIERWWASMVAAVAA